MPEYGPGTEPSRSWAVYSFGILIQQTTTSKRPMVTIHNFARMVLHDEILLHSVVDVGYDGSKESPQNRLEIAMLSKSCEISAKSYDNMSVPW